MRTSEYFVTAQRDNGESFVKLSDDAPEWLRDAVMDAHDGELPNDWRYAMCEAIVRELEERDDWDDAPFEIADQLVDIYDADAARWLADDISRSEIVGEYLADTEGLVTDNDIIGAIRGGQFYAVERMAFILAEAIGENVSES